MHRRAKTTRVVFLLSEPEKRRLDEEAVRLRISVAELVRRRVAKARCDEVAVEAMCDRVRDSFRLAIAAIDATLARMDQSERERPARIRRVREQVLAEVRAHQARNSHEGGAAGASIPGKTETTSTNQANPRQEPINASRTRRARTRRG